MPKDTSETQKGATGLARAAIVVVCVVLTVFGFFSGSHLSDEHEEVHTFEMAKYKSIGARHRTEVAVDQNRDRSSYAAGASQAQNGRGVSKNTAGGRGRPDPKDGPVDWANVPCDDMSLDGRKFLVASFIDEQMASANTAIDHVYNFCRNTNRTFVELMAGSRAINLKGTVATSQYHQSCPGSFEQIKFQRYGALYDLNILRKSGLSIADADEFWRLRECGLLPKQSTYLPHGESPGGVLPGRDSCFQCNKQEGVEEIVTLIDFETSERIGARNQMMCPFHSDAEQWYDVAVTDALVVETCCIRKEWMGKLRTPPKGKPAVEGPLDYVFSTPRFFATRFLESSGLAKSPAGYIGLQFRAEKMVKQWKHFDRFMDEVHAKVDKAIEENTVDGVKPRIFYACDFLDGGSLSYHPSGRAKVNLMKLPNKIGEKHGALIQLSAEKDLPEALAANNNMLIAATELIIMARAKAFIPLVPSGRFQGMVNSEHKTHALEGGNRDIPITILKPIKKMD